MNENIKGTSKNCFLCENERNCVRRGGEVKMAAGVATLRRGPVLPHQRSMARFTLVCSRNEFLEVPIIAEDNQILQDVNEELMSVWDYDFDMVSNGLEAVEHAQKNEGEYDLCLMDIDMPVMNGLMATKIIRQQVKYFPIMALSGNTEYREQCFKAGMDDFLEKPCSPDVLLDKINELTIKSFKFEIKDMDIHSHAKSSPKIQKPNHNGHNVRGKGHLINT